MISFTIHRISQTHLYTTALIPVKTCLQKRSVQATFTSQKCDGYTLFSQDKIYKKINKTLGEDGLEGVLENIDGNEAAELAWMQ